jgi:hypothetical protein
MLCSLISEMAQSPASVCAMFAAKHQWLLFCLPATALQANATHTHNTGTGTIRQTEGLPNRQLLLAGRYSNSKQRPKRIAQDKTCCNRICIVPLVLCHVETQPMPVAFAHRVHAEDAARVALANGVFALNREACMEQSTVVLSPMVTPHANE